MLNIFFQAWKIMMMWYAVGVMHEALDAFDFDDLMTADEYVDYLEEVWLRPHILGAI